MPKVRTHYDNLQIARTASDAVVRAAYRGLSQLHHPDKNPEDRETAERIMKVINEAYAVLSDPVRRRDHDEWIDSQESEQHQNDNSPSQKTQQSTEPSEELIVTSKRWVAIGYFLFAVAMLVYGLSAWFSPIGGEGWTGRGPMGIPMEYVQIFERFVGAPIGFWMTIYMGPVVLSGTLMIISPTGIRFSDSGGQLFKWSEISRCEDDGKHIVLCGIRNDKKWKKRFIRSMVAGNIEQLVQRVQCDIQRSNLSAPRL